MATVIEIGVESPQARIEREIEAAKQEVRPISRRTLATILVRERSISLADAESLVDAYCDEKAPYTPDFLTKEFMLPYLKIASMLLVILSLVIIGYAANLQLSHKPSWIPFVVGAILFLFSGMGLLRILQTEREN